MFTSIQKELEKQEKFSITENGAIGYKSTGSELVDINYKVSSLRQCEEKEIVNLFDKAFNENKEYALKWLFFARDVREGLGERRLFRICYKRLAVLDIDVFYKNLENISEYGRWDDLVSLIGISNDTDKYIITIMQNQLNKDLDNFKENKPISLLAKWLPSENASSTNTRIMAKRIIRLLEMTPRKYRLMLSELRAYSNVVEVKMTNNEWNDIDYEKVPSLANLKYKNAFMKHDEARRLEYLQSVEKGTSRINMKVATPVDIVARYSNGYYGLNDYDQTLEVAWDNLKDIMVEDTLVVADGSGSMMMRISGKTKALDVANALAIYTAQHNSSIYRNKYITFSSKPQFVEFNENDSLKAKLEIAQKHDEIANTNIEAVFDLILGVAIENNISQEEMIKNILIISDMEFDMAQRGWNGSENLLTKPLFEVIAKRYADAGYTLPRLIFWNVNSRTQTIPLTQNELGVALVSCFSQNVLKMVMSSKYNPYEVLVETITSPRYDRIKV
ncbi:DUF2828 family protein [Methanobrevibacter sp.]|uniref:DUF2828 family protein n=1 Tax=Methanobrevibacter sp. TaxID=66852 RepID=UPI003890225E